MKGITMKSIKRRFESIQEKKPLWSSYICFATAIKGQKFSRQTIHRWFPRLVEKDDYARGEKKEILCFLERLSNNLEGNKN